MRKYDQIRTRNYLTSRSSQKYDDIEWHVLYRYVNGCIVWGKHNIVGSWNDGEISRDFQIKLLNSNLNLEGHGVLSDSAFPVSNEMGLHKFVICDASVTPDFRSVTVLEVFHC
eukprot:gene18787-26589_t